MNRQSCIDEAQRLVYAAIPMPAMTHVADREVETCECLEAYDDAGTDDSEPSLLGSASPVATQRCRLSSKAIISVTVLLGLFCLLSQWGVIFRVARLGQSDRGAFQDSNHLLYLVCSYPMEGDGYAPPDMSNRRCGTCCGANDVTSSMCSGATFDGRLMVSEAVIQARCNADSACAGYQYDTWKDYYRPVSSIASVVPDPQWRTYKKMCQAILPTAPPPTTLPPAPPPAPPPTTHPPAPPPAPSSTTQSPLPTTTTTTKAPANNDGLVLLTSAFLPKDGNQHIHEIYAAINTNFLNEHLAAVHVLTECDCDQVKQMLVQWAKRTPDEAQILRQMDKKLTCASTEDRAQPTYGDFFRYADKSLSHRIVLLSNGDVVFDDTLGLINPGPVKKQEHGYVLSVQSPQRNGFYNKVFHRECDLAPRCAVGNWAGGGSWGQASAGTSWDVYVFSPPLSSKMDLGHIDNLVMNIFGAENLAGFQLEVRANISLFNPCYHVHAFHWHCQGVVMHSPDIKVRVDHPKWYMDATNETVHTTDAVSDIFPCWNCPGIKMPEGAVRTEEYCRYGTVLNSSQADALQKNFRTKFVNTGVCCKDPSTCHTLPVEWLKHCVKAEDVDCVTWDAARPHTYY